MVVVVEAVVEDGLVDVARSHIRSLVDVGDWDTYVVTASAGGPDSQEEEGRGEREMESGCADGGLLHTHAE